MNEVKIVVTGQNKTGGFANVKKDIQGIGTITEDASKTAARALDELNKAGSASFDRLSAKMNAAFDEIDAKAKKVAADSVDRFKASTDKLNFGDAFDFDSRGIGQKLLSGITKATMGAADLAQSGAKMAGSLWDGFVNVVDQGLPPQAKAGIVLALAGAATVVGPAAGGALAGGVVAGFGAGIAGLGILAAAQTTQVKEAFGDLWADLSGRAQANSQVVADMLVRFSGRVKATFEDLEPAVRGALTRITPSLERFGDALLKSFERFAPALEPIADAASKVFEDIGRRLPGIVGELGDEFSELAEEISRNPEALGDFIAFAGEAAEIALDLMGALNRAWEQWKKMAELATTMPWNWDDLGKGKDAADGAAEGLGRIAKVGPEAASSTDALTQAFAGLADAGATAAQRGDDILTILDRMAGRTPGFQESVQGINDTIRGLLDDFSQAGAAADGFGSALINADGTINTATANGSKLLDAMNDLREGFANMAGATKELEMAGLSHEEALAKVNGQMMEQRQRLIDSHDQMGLTKEAMLGLLSTYGLNPAQLLTIAKLDAEEARKVRDELIRNRTMTISVNYLTTQALGAGSNGGVVLGGPNRVMAHGGVSPGGWTTVGELGPERVMLPPGAQVMPNTSSAPLQAQQSGGGMGGGAYVIGVEPLGSMRGLEGIFLDWLQYAVRTGKLQLMPTPRAG